MLRIARALMVLLLFLGIAMFFMWLLSVVVYRADGTLAERHGYKPIECSATERWLLLCPWMDKQ